MRLLALPQPSYTQTGLGYAGRAEGVNVDPSERLSAGGHEIAKMVERSADQAAIDKSAAIATGTTFAL